jgi:hypothetical protein
MPEPESDIIDDDLDYGTDWMISEDLRVELQKKQQELEEREETVTVLEKRVKEADRANILKHKRLEEKEKEIRRLEDDIDDISEQLTKIRKNAVGLEELQAIATDAEGRFNTLLHRLHVSEHHWYRLSAALWHLRAHDRDKGDPCWCTAALHQDEDGNEIHTKMCEMLRQYFSCPPLPVAEYTPVKNLDRLDILNIFSDAPGFDNMKVLSMMRSDDA